MRKQIYCLLSFLWISCLSVSAADRWAINSAGGITWQVDERVPHEDHIEMSGLRVSTVLRYGVDANGAFMLNRSMVWPMLRTIPNNTHASLMRRFAWNVTDMVEVNGQSLLNEKVKEVTLNGTMVVQSEYTLPRKGKLGLTRILFPSVSNPAFCEKYILRNIGESAISVEIPSSRSVVETDAAKGVDGSYKLVSTINGQVARQLQPGEELTFSATFAGYKKDERELSLDIDRELQARQDLIAGFWDNLVLDTPDPVINTMFAFAKIRGAESIYDTKGGLMHGPGGESYYAAIWANDQAEYINPFFPYLGYEVGNRKGKLGLTRILFPSVSNPAFCEKYILRNIGESAISVEIPSSRSVVETDAAKGVDGSYKLVSTINGQVARQLQPGEELTFSATFAGYKKDERELSLDIDRELQARQDLIAGFWDNLVLDTPDPVINTMFAFAKIRGAESIYDTKGGLMHGPGGESYYAAIWANDQAEYINPFFPYLGYEVGNRSALCSYEHFARFMNPEYKPLPSSIIAEGIDVWAGAGDRGDAAMVAYGASRYALSKGDKAEAEKLWPLIEWCLEYCRRNLNKSGVVASDADELENRFPAGKANLCTSSLYYDALISAGYLGKDLGKPVAAYARQATALKKNIDRYFGGTVEGFDTYKYYEGNDVLRSWICIPLTVGIQDRKDATIQALFSPRLWTENGLLTQAGSETFWDRSTLYALRGVYACGETEKATDYLRFYSSQRLLGEHVPYAIEAWPEGNQRHLSAESGLYCRIITEGMFGIRPTGLNSFVFTPRLPQEWDHMNLRKICAFNQVFDIEVKRLGDQLQVAVIADGKTISNRKIKEGENIRIKF